MKLMSMFRGGGDGCRHRGHSAGRARAGPRAAIYLYVGPRRLSMTPAPFAPPPGGKLGGLLRAGWRTRIGGMRIALNMLFVAPGLAGGRVYCEGLLKGLQAVGGEDEY